MARVELIIPKMGESVTEATVISWNKNVGDIVEMDETIIEIATDKVDSEVPSTSEGKLVEQLFQVDDVVKVGQAFAVLETGEDDSTKDDKQIESPKDQLQANEVKEDISLTSDNLHVTKDNYIPKINIKDSDRFYSPLVKNMATKEGVTIKELEGIKGSGKDGRVTKNDMASYISSRGVEKLSDSNVEMDVNNSNITSQNIEKNTPLIQPSGDIEIVEMDRMRKLISSHMTMSKQTSAHITSFVEADMTKIVNWRNKAKKSFKEREGENITFTPIIIEAMVKAVKDFPLINVSVEGTNIHIHKNINVGMAAALPDGNLIVPVIDKCQNKNLYGITKSVNDLAMRARAGELKPDEISGGTITMTNVGTFGNLMGTPIINQPQLRFTIALD